MERDNDEQEQQHGQRQQESHNNDLIENKNEIITRQAATDQHKNNQHQAAPSSSEAAAESSKRQQQTEPSAELNQQNPNRTKAALLSNRSQSSPSSLTTHKFGLRPTPSPPRLIIDHQTGDIVESYPEHPVYLRTYQPLESSITTPAAASDAKESCLDLVAGGGGDRCTGYLPADDESLPLTNQQQQQQFSQDYQQTMSSPSSRDNFVHPQQQHHHRSKQVIPPPHSGKVYFAPPETNNSEQNVSNFLDFQRHQPFAATSTAATQPAPPTARPTRSSGSSFKRAVNRLNEGRTDIAIVTEPDEGDATLDYRGGRPVEARSQMRVTATSASRANALLAQHDNNNASNSYTQVDQKKPPASSSSSLQRKPNSFHQQKSPPTKPNQSAANQQQQQYCLAKSRSKLSNHHQPPAIEEFKLYNVCFLFRVLLVLLLSSLIIYLLVVPLHQDCAKFRPTYTYISIITSSVNLVFVIIFTLFWYCNGVSRTMYANLSSSGFIVSIYSILVAINLTLAIVFFFLNTCHFQRIISDEQGHHLSSLMMTSENQHDQYNMAMKLLKSAPLNVAMEEHVVGLNGNVAGSGGRRQARDLNWKQQHSTRTTATRIERQLGGGFEPTVIDDNIGPTSATADDNSSPDGSPGDDTGDDADGEDTGAGQQPRAQSTSTTTTINYDESNTINPYAAPKISPIEAAWEHIKEQLRSLRRKFSQFLMTYDLKFVGALHALCAICLQYLAIKVAVVRSYYCSPVGFYA